MYHKARTNQAIHQEVAYILKRYIGDPRLQNVVITQAKLSKKSEYVDISITQIDSSYDHIEVLNILQKAAPKIRSYVAKSRSHAHRTPRLRFHYDSDLEKKVQLHQLINESVDLH